MKDNITLIEEWGRECDVMVALPHIDSDWGDFIDEAEAQYHVIVDALTAAGVDVVMLCNPDTRSRQTAHDIKREIDNNPGALTIIEISINDTWIRDYGPLTIGAKGKPMRLVDFGFNGWGLKFASDLDNTACMRLQEWGWFADDAYADARAFTLEGGSVESDGLGTILTTSRCLCSPNRNGYLTKPQAEAALHKYLGATKVLWLDHGALQGDDTDSHIDTLARICPDHTIAYVKCTDTADPHYDELKLMESQLRDMRTADGSPYRLVALPLPAAVYDPEDGHRIPASYANYLVTDTHLFMPTYRQPDNDNNAIEAIKGAFPNHKVVGVECLTLLRQHGSLHCATMQVPKGLIKIPSL